MTTDSDLVYQLKGGSTCAFDQLYKRYYPSIEKLVLSNNGSREDAQDIFQETVLILNENIKRPEFALTASLKTYLYSISRNLWLKALDKRSNVSSIEGNESSVNSLKDNSEEETERQKNVSSFIERIISKAPHHCKQIIDFVFFKNATPEQVAEELGYNNNHTLSNVKYKCIQQMKRASNNKELSV